MLSSDQGHTKTRDPYEPRGYFRSLGFHMPGHTLPTDFEAYGSSVAGLMLFGVSRPALCTKHLIKTAILDLNPLPLDRERWSVYEAAIQRLKAKVIHSPKYTRKPRSGPSKGL